MATSGKLAKGPRPPSLCPQGAGRPWLKIVQFLRFACCRAQPWMEGIHPTIQPSPDGGWGLCLDRVSRCGELPRKWGFLSQKPWTPVSAPLLTSCETLAGPTRVSAWLSTSVRLLMQTLRALPGIMWAQKVGVPSASLAGCYSNSSP